jgi:hypothetical protein
VVRKSGDAEFIKASHACVPEASSQMVRLLFQQVTRCHSAESTRWRVEGNFLFVVAGMLRPNRDVSQDLAIREQGCWSCTSGSRSRTSNSYQQTTETESRRPCLARPSSAKAEGEFRVVPGAIELPQTSPDV